MEEASRCESDQFEKIRINATRFRVESGSTESLRNRKRVPRLLRRINVGEKKKEKKKPLPNQWTAGSRGSHDTSNGPCSTAWQEPHKADAFGTEANQVIINKWKSELFPSVRFKQKMLHERILEKKYFIPINGKLKASKFDVRNKSTYLQETRRAKRNWNLLMRS